MTTQIKKKPIKVQCPSCGKKHEINIGSIIAHSRWDDATPEYKLEVGKKLALARKAKKDLSPTVKK